MLRVHTPTGRLEGLNTSLQPPSTQQENRPSRVCVIRRLAGAGSRPGSAFAREFPPHLGTRTVISGVKVTSRTIILDRGGSKPYSLWSLTLGAAVLQTTSPESVPPQAGDVNVLGWILLFYFLFSKNAAALEDLFWGFIFYCDNEESILCVESDPS